MIKTPSKLLRLLALLALGACGPARAAENGSPQLLEQPAPAVAPCPCGAPQGTGVVGGSHVLSGDGHAGRFLHGRHAASAGYGHGAAPVSVARAPHPTGLAAHGDAHHLGLHEHADARAARAAAATSWHAGYYNTQYGAPVALVVPPTARMSTRWGWGVSQSSMSPIYQQFERPYPGPMMVDPATGMGPNPLLPTPRWPSHTDQFGVYYVRSPW